MNNVARPAGAHRQTARIKAFSDGVFAIAITLLALDLRVPHVEPVTATGLAHAILDQWPAYFAFVLSFATILIMWINHHARMAWVERVDGLLIFSNGLVLLMIAALAFPTALVGEYLTGPAGTTAVATYALFVLGTSAAWNVFMIALKPERGLLRPGVSLEAISATRRRVRLGLVFHGATAGLFLLKASVRVGFFRCLRWLCGRTRYPPPHMNVPQPYSPRS